MRIRSHNLPAGRTPKSEGVPAMRHTLTGADIVLWQELEEYTTGTLQGLRGKHLVGGTVAQRMRPVSFSPRTMQHSHGWTINISGGRGWPRSVAPFRGLLVMEFFRERSTGRKVAVFNVHMPHRATRWPRSRAYSRIVDALAGFAVLLSELGYVVVLGGDWNATPSHKLLKPLRDVAQVVSPGGTHRSRRGLKPIDFFFLLGGTVESADVLPKYAGDHYPVELVVS